MNHFSRPILVGMDGGSTKTRLIVSDSTGHVLGRAAGGPSNCGLFEMSRLVDNFDGMFEEAARQSGTQVLDVVYLGSAGVNRASDFSTLEAIIRKTSSVSLGKVCVDTDAMIGLAGGLCRDSGVVLIAGTGSVCFGRSPLGKTWQTGGREYLVDDRGSAYRIALEGLIAAVRSADRRGQVTALEGTFFELLGISTPSEIVSRLHYPRAAETLVDKTYLAGLAPYVFSCALSGDGVASAIIDREVNELIHMVDVVVRQLEWTESEVPLVLIGSVANRPEIRQTIASRLRQINPTLRILDPILSPEGGALLLAAKLAGVQTGPAFVANVRDGEFSKSVL